MSEFRALVLREADGKVSAQIERLPETALPDGEVIIDVEYSTLNYKDGLILKGLGRLVRKYPHVPGVDFAGRVSLSTTPEYRPGDAVLLTGWRVGEVHWGGFAEKARVKASQLVRLPQGLTTKRAMAVGTAGFTAMLAVMALEEHGLKPGAGRVLGLTSVAALRRRLALDFSDMTDKGLAFDTVRGDFDLREGNAYTDNVLVTGPAAEIGLIGRVGLKNKDYDQTAVVTGSVGNSLPLAALAGGPVVAGAVLIFTQVFKQPLKGLARGYYRITGSWDNPIVERIKSADAPGASAEAPK